MHEKLTFRLRGDQGEIADRLDRLLAQD